MKKRIKICNVSTEVIVTTPGSKSTFWRKIDSDFCKVLSELQDDPIKKVILECESLKEIATTYLNSKLREEEKDVSAREQTRKFLRDYAN